MNVLPIFLVLCILRGTGANNVLPHIEASHHLKKQPWSSRVIWFGRLEALRKGHVCA